MAVASLDTYTTAIVDAVDTYLYANARNYGKTTAGLSSPTVGQYVTIAESDYAPSGNVAYHGTASSTIGSSYSKLTTVNDHSADEYTTIYVDNVIKYGLQTKYEGGGGNNSGSTARNSLTAPTSDECGAKLKHYVSIGLTENVPSAYYTAIDRDTYKTNLSNWVKGSYNKSPSKQLALLDLVESAWEFVMLTTKRYFGVGAVGLYVTSATLPEGGVSIKYSAFGVADVDWDSLISSVIQYNNTVTLAVSVVSTSSSSSSSCSSSCSSSSSSSCSSSSSSSCSSSSSNSSSCSSSSWFVGYLNVGGI